MLNSLFLAIRFLILIFSGHKHVALENIALRHQLAVFTSEKKRPRLRNRDRWFWIALKKLWKDWRTALEFVRPETVTGWQSKRFKRYWWRLSQSKKPGRPRVYLEIRKLIRTMAATNPIWGAPRIHGELLKLGFEISERTVSRLMLKRDRKPSQTWMTFLRNHVGQLVSIDFFTVATIRLQVLYVSSSWRMIVAASSILMSRSIPRRDGLHSKLSKHFRKTALRALWSEIGTESTVKRSDPEWKE